MGKIEQKVIFVVAKGMFENKLFLDSGFYSLFPSTTDEILAANWYEDEAKAIEIAKKAGGQVYRYKLTPSEKDEQEASEIDMLRAAVKQLQKERDDALLELEKIKDRKETNEQQREK